VRVSSPALRSNRTHACSKDLKHLGLVALLLRGGVEDVAHQDGRRHLVGGRARERGLEAPGEAGGEAYPVGSRLAEVGGTRMFA